MLVATVTEQFFHGYFAEWMAIYKQGAVRPVTYQKYLVTLRRLVELAPSLRLTELDKRSYQTLINDYAITHEKQTTMDFHHHLKGTILVQDNDKIVLYLSMLICIFIDKYIDIFLLWCILMIITFTIL